MSTLPAGLSNRESHGPGPCVDATERPSVQAHLHAKHWNRPLVSRTTVAELVQLTALSSE